MLIWASFKYHVTQLLSTVTVKLRFVSLSLDTRLLPLAPGTQSASADPVTPVAPETDHWHLKIQGLQQNK